MKFYTYQNFLLYIQEDGAGCFREEYVDWLCLSVYVVKALQGRGVSSDRYDADY